MKHWAPLFGARVGGTWPGWWLHHRLAAVRLKVLQVGCSLVQAHTLCPCSCCSWHIPLPDYLHWRCKQRSLTPLPFL